MEFDLRRRVQRTANGVGHIQENVENTFYGVADRRETAQQTFPTVAQPTLQLTAGRPEGQQADDRRQNQTAVVARRR